MSQVSTTPGGPTQKYLVKKMLEEEERRKHPDELEEIQIIVKYNIKKVEKKTHQKTSITKDGKEETEEILTTQEDAAVKKEEFKQQVKDEKVKQEVRQEYLTSSDDEDQEEEEEEEEEEEIEYEEEAYPSPLNYSYFSRQNRSCLSNLPLKTEKEKRKFDTEDRLLKYLDKVDVEIIASVETNKLLAKHLHSPNQ